MPKTYEYPDPNRLRLIEELKVSAGKENARIWDVVAKELSGSRKNRREVNLWSVNKNTQEGDVIIIPGKLLGKGNLDHKIDIAAFKFSVNAREKIKNAGGNAMLISELIKKNPKGSNVKIIG